MIDMYIIINCLLLFVCFFVLFCHKQVDVILTAEHLLHVLHIHKYFSTKPSPVILTPNKTEVFSFKKAAMKLVKNIIYYLSGGEQYDAVTFKGALKYYLVRN